MVTKTQPLSKKNAAKNNHEVELQAAERQLMAAKRMLKVRQAQDSLMDFTQLSMPSPQEPDDPDASRYIVARHHHAIANALEKVESGEILRLVITVPPRHGKSELASKRFPAWFVGRDPYRHIIVSSYNDSMAAEFGSGVRDIMQSPMYAQVFPNSQLKKGAASVDRLQTTEGGILHFVGTGSSLTGRGGDLLLLDDPIKNREEADSKAFRDKQWAWFADVFMSRLMDHMGRVIIIMTRWHEDDLVGRLTDSENSYYDYEIAKHWNILHLPALAEEDDPLGREKDEPLWPERITYSHLDQMRRLNSRGFAALYQGRPAPEDGDFIRREDIKTYKSPADLPSNLRIYMSGDFAVSTEQDRDKTCLMVVGVDENEHIWVLPETWWQRQRTDMVVEASLGIMATKHPLYFWAERGHISRSIGPFLRKRMMESNVYCTIDEITPIKDKVTRAQAIAARMSMGMVHFPEFAPWWSDARHEMLTFPNSKHDDFVDALAYIGLGLQKITRSTRKLQVESKGPKPGTMAWVKEAHIAEQKQKRLMNREGF